MRCILLLVPLLYILQVVLIEGNASALSLLLRLPEEPFVVLNRCLNDLDLAWVHDPQGQCGRSRRAKAANSP